MIRVDGVHKSFGHTAAVRGISFRVGRGEVVGFVGPNGAGKSTTLRIITGYLQADGGRVQVAGHDVARARRAACAQIGYLPESVPLYPEMRVESYLTHRGRLKGVSRRAVRERVDMVVEQAGLGEVRRQVIGTLSKGFRQRVGIADALVGRPPILILDEPTAGLDPNQVRELRALLAELSREHTVLLSSHVLPEIERAADRVIVIARGAIVGEGTREELAATAGLAPDTPFEDVFAELTEAAGQSAEAGS